MPKPRKKRETDAERRKRLLPFTPPAGRSPLQELPPELRVNILGHLLTYDAEITPRHKVRLRDKKLALSILRVNKQLYEEAGSVFYGTNTFRVSISKSWNPFILKADYFRTCLKTVEFVDDSARGGTVACLKALRTCTGLRSISISYDMADWIVKKVSVSPMASTETFDIFQAGVDLFETLQSIQASEDRGKSPFRPVKVICPPVCWFCSLRHHTTCSKQLSCDEKLTGKTLKDLCAEYETKINDALVSGRKAALQNWQNAHERKNEEHKRLILGRR